VWESNPPFDPLRAESPALKAREITGSLSPPLFVRHFRLRSLLELCNPPVFRNCAAAAAVASETPELLRVCSEIDGSARDGASTTVSVHHHLFLGTTLSGAASFQVSAAPQDFLVRTILENAAPLPGQVWGCSYRADETEVPAAAKTGDISSSAKERKVRTTRGSN
jgi:hypothetical protein